MSDTTTDQSSLHWDPSKLHFEFPIPNQEARLKQLVLYISEQCVDDPTYSKVKLYKILFFSDFEHYGRYGTPITGMSYRKLPWGPGPAAFGRIENEMLRERQIRIVKQKVWDHSSHRLLPLEEPQCELFNGREIAVVSYWIRFFWNMKAKKVSDYSHGKAWHIAGKSQLIPYEAVFISDEPVTYEDVERVNELAARYGWKTQ